MGMLYEDVVKTAVLLAFLGVCSGVSGESGTETESQPDLQDRAFQDLFLLPNHTEATSLTSGGRQTDRKEGIERHVQKDPHPLLSNTQGISLSSKSDVKRFPPSVSNMTPLVLTSADNTTNFEGARPHEIPENAINLYTPSYQEQEGQGLGTVHATGNADAVIGKAYSGATATDEAETPTGVTNVSKTQLSDFSWDPSSKCPEVSFSCRRTFYASVALPCSCDRLCLVYNDCCPDIRSVVPNVYEAAVQTRNQYEDIETSCPTVNVVTISNCPTTARAENTLLGEQCGSELQLNDINSIPVTDNATGLQFANTYCALCHGVLPENIVPWTAQLTMHGFRALMTDLHRVWASDSGSITDSFSSFLRSFKKGSGFYWMTAAEHREQTRPCIPDAIATCPDLNGKAHPLGHACQFGPIAYVMEFDEGWKIFRNPSCLVCKAPRDSNQTCEAIVSRKLTYRGPVFSGLLRSRPDHSGLDVSIKVHTSTTSKGGLPWTTAVCSFSNAVNCKITQCKQPAVLSSLGTCIENQTVSLNVDMKGDFAFYWYNKTRVDRGRDTATPFCGEVLALLLQQPTLSNETATYVDALGVVNFTSLQCRGVIRKPVKPSKEPYDTFRLEMLVVLREVLTRRNFTGLVSFCATAQYVNSTASCLDPGNRNVLLLEPSPSLRPVTESGSSQAGSPNVCLVLLVLAWGVCFILWTGIWP